MSSTIVVPARDALGNHPPAIADALIAGLTAASADISATQSGGSVGVSGIHLVRAASTTNVTLTAVSTSMDGVTLVAGDRVLVKDQSTGADNGIYVVGTVVAGPVAPFTRATDFDADAEAQTGVLVAVSEGTVSADRVYQLTTNAPITVGSTSLTFAALTVTSVSGHLPILNMPLGIPRIARGVVFTNVASLASFTVAGNDGITYVAGDRVLLALQTTAAQCGLYSVGTVGGGTAALTRVTDLTTGDVAVNGHIIEVSEGTIFAGSTWKSLATGTVTIGSVDPLYYPRVCKGVATLSSGVYALGVTEGFFMASTTKSPVLVTRDTANTSTATTGGYAVPVATKTAGKSGTAAATITAQVAAGTTNTADVSTLSWQCTNW